jgi:diguanylate cyclase (GGDEF)-like protein
LEQSRFQIPFGVIFMDIDHFKQVNDTFGHDVGDQVLRFVADTLIKSARPFDVFGRWGGEEFIGIIRNIHGNPLKKLADRIRTLVAGAYIEHEGEKIQVTLSAGVTMVGESDTPESLIKRADGLLYQSKTAGRNCTSFS